MQKKIIFKSTILLCFVFISNLLLEEDFIEISYVWGGGVKVLAGRDVPWKYFFLRAPCHTKTICCVQLDIIELSGLSKSNTNIIVTMI